MCLYTCISLLYNRNYHNIVNQLYFNLKKKVELVGLIVTRSHVHAFVGSYVESNTFVELVCLFVFKWLCNLQASRDWIDGSSDLTGLVATCALIGQNCPHDCFTWVGLFHACSDVGEEFLRRAQSYLNSLVYQGFFRLFRTCNRFLSMSDSIKAALWLVWNKSNSKISLQKKEYRGSLQSNLLQRVWEQCHCYRDSWYREISNCMHCIFGWSLWSLFNFLGIILAPLMELSSVNFSST